MFLIYTPDGQEEQRWTVDLGKFRSAEAEAIEKRTGLEWGGTYREKLLRGGMLARRALLWTLLRREHLSLRFEDVDFADGELTLEFDAGELTEQRAEVEKSPALNDDDRAMALAYIDGQLATAVGAPGKATESESGAATG